MVEEAVIRITLAAVIGTLAAIVYCLRVLVLMERRVGRIEAHLDTLIHRVLKEEKHIERLVKRKR